MEIKDCILITKNCLTKGNIKTLMKIVDETKYEEAKILNENGLVLNTEERKVKEKPFRLDSESMTEFHWLNYLGSIFMNGNNNYYKTFNLDPQSNSLLNISILRYENSDHYKFHIDSGKDINRTLSMILMVNDDYEGGDLLFKDILNNKEIIIPKKAGNLIVWPSNFLFPHCVTPVTKGVRYSVVSWAL